MKRFLSGLLLLVAMAAPLAALAQGADDHRKALLWWLTTQRIWQDNNQPVQQQPLPDSAGLTLDQVQKQLKTSDGKNQDASAYDLYNDVEGALKSRKMRLAAPLEIAQQIEEQLRNKRKGKSTYASVDSLKKQFDVLLQSKQAGPVANDPASSAEPSLNIKTDSVKQQSDQKSGGTAINNSSAIAPAYSIMYVIGAGIFGALFGGIIAGWWLSQRGKKAAASDEARIDRKYRTEMTEFQQAYNRLEGDKIRLQMQLDELRRPHQPEQRKGGGKPAGREVPAIQPTAPIAAPTVAPTPMTDAAVAVGETVEFAVEPTPALTAPPPSPTRHYAPALETNFLEDRQLQPHSLTHLPVEITLDPTNPQRARFGLNPGVEQRLVIDDGVNRLTEFFAFERPIQKPTSLRPGPAGELKREEGGWRVVKKAGLELS